MIYLEGLESIIECIYLNDELDNRASFCEVFVNPSSTKYLVGKTVIINAPDYPKDKVSLLLNNGCKVISRIFTDQEGVEVCPYILRLNTNIQWNGRIINDYADLIDLLENNECEFSIDDYMLYFPKINSIKVGNLKAMDAFGNLTAAGWASQQVGINLVNGSVFSNLDIIKTGKVLCGSSN